MYRKIEFGQSVIRWAIGHVGRRGVLLVLLGIGWIASAFAFAENPRGRFSGPVPGGPLEAIEHSLIPVVLWGLGGTVALLSGLLRHRVHDDAWGFNGLIIPPAVWWSFYVWSYGASVFTGGAVGRPQAITGVILYTLIVVLVLFVARWPDPDDPNVLPIRAEVDE